MSKVWFITGASSGIGAGVVKAALEAGDRVVATARNLEKLRTALGPLAGYSLLGHLESLTTEQIDQQLATNFRGVLNVMLAALPVMRRQRSGHVLNVTSMAGVIGYATASAYAASKFAVEGLSLSVAQEVAPFGIKVTVVEPGFFRTDLLAPQSVVFGERAVAGYDPPAAVQAHWATYNGTQSGDPAKLGQALVTIAAMESPPRQFFAGSPDWVPLY
ncbi:MAG: SDR family NAD(P)-dependent oxidoreductase, partial [Myxococcales bacterium]